MLNKVFSLEINKAIRIYEDNSSAILIAKYGNFTKNSRYIEVQYHFVNENYENNKIEVIKIDSENNVADLFTKSLSKAKFIRFREMLMLSE